MGIYYPGVTSENIMLYLLKLLYMYSDKNWLTGRNGMVWGYHCKIKVKGQVKTYKLFAKEVFKVCGSVHVRTEDLSLYLIKVLCVPHFEVINT